MASRLAYGMAEEKLLPAIFTRVGAKRRTPWVGIFFSSLVVAFLVFTGTLQALAQTTSFLILSVFFLVHLSLLKIKLQKNYTGGFSIPSLVPLLGMLASLSLMLQFDQTIILRSLILAGLGLGVWIIQKIKITST